MHYPLSTRSFEGRRVLVTGHTGFKGAWLCETLLEWGAQVWGFSLAPEPGSLFETLGLGHRMHDGRGDLRSLESVKDAVGAATPEYVFHLGAQSLVRHAHAAPVQTFETNVLGTVNLLEALRSHSERCVAILATTDKCYENAGRGIPFTESEPLGGTEPYSASKAAAEIAIQAYRASYFGSGRIAVASVRAGNVIGGGDSAIDRILPDSMRALARNAAIPVRNPASIRPWQHVLDCLNGYLTLAAQLDHAELGSERRKTLATAFNFGPDSDSVRSVQDLVEEVLRHWPGRWERAGEASAPAEASTLSLSSKKAHELLGWQPRWSFEDSVQHSVSWFQRQAQGASASDMAAFTRSQIQAFYSTTSAEVLPHL